VSRADARAGRHIGGGVWRLEDPVRIEVSSEGVRQAPAGPFAELGEALPAEVDTRLFSVEQLRDQIAEVERSGHDATVYRVDLFVKLAAPVACLVLPALALFFAISGPPYPSAAATLVMSVIVSVSYVLLTGVSTSLGYGKALSPVLAGLAPAGLFGLLALYFGLRLRGFGQTF
jgi:lipopolysaccharide export LptBFGC system permease protein LptF